MHAEPTASEADVTPAMETAAGTDSGEDGVAEHAPLSS